MSIKNAIDVAGIVLQTLALIAVSLSIYFLVTKTQEILKGNRVNQYIEKMETYHENLSELANSYHYTIVNNPDDVEHATELWKKLRDTLARLRQIKNNWMGFFDDDSRSTVALYMEALDRLDNALGSNHNANALQTFLEARVDFGRKRNCISQEVNRQFFGIGEPDAQCRKEEETCARAPGPPLFSRQRSQPSC